jgi:small subunit ribosomal protein S27Ae
VKLAVLKYYKVAVLLYNWVVYLSRIQVDENGKITRLRKECNQPTCGGGVFMAVHTNRHYCGKCYQTLVVQDPKDKDKVGTSKKAAGAK